MILSRSRSSGFTLTELIVVVAIMGILVGLLSPAIGWAYDLARASRCLGNLKGMGPAFMAFASDNDGRLPPSLITNNTNPNNNWWYYISPYLGKTVKSWADLSAASSPWGPMGCPVTKVDSKAYPNIPWSSYKMSRIYRIALSQGGAAPTSGLPLIRVKNAAQSLLVAEGRNNPEFITYTTENAFAGLSYPHHNKLNALFVDGHVETCSQDNLKERWDEIYTNAANY